MIATGLRYHQS